MKKILFTILLFVGVSSSVFASEFKQVIVSEGHETVFRFTGLVEGDSCNFISIIPEITLVSHDKKRKVKVYRFDYGTMQTVMGCSDNKTTKWKITSSEMKTQKNETVFFFIPNNLELEILR